MKGGRSGRGSTIYDLAAALYALDPRGFTFVETTAVMRPNTLLEFGRGTRQVKLCTGLPPIRSIATFGVR